MNYGFVINNKICIGCHACSVACKSENEVPLGVNRTWVKYVEKESLEIQKFERNPPRPRPRRFAPPPVAQAPSHPGY